MHSYIRLTSSIRNKTYIRLFTDYGIGVLHKIWRASVKFVESSLVSH